jgi:hypothetical protein
MRKGKSSTNLVDFELWGLAIENIHGLQAILHHFNGSIEEALEVTMG